MPLAWIVERCLSKDPEDRYAATRDLARELMQVRDHLGRLTGGLPRATGSVDRTVPAGAETLRTTAAVPARGPSAASAASGGTAAPGGAVPATPTREPALRRVLRVVGAAAGMVAVLGAGAGLGWWLRERTVEPQRSWDGELVLGPDTPVLASRLAPDGQTLAFVTPVGGVAQAAVMKPASGDWVVLTRRPDAGSVYRVAWSPDGTRVFYDRVTDVPHGVFSVPVVGGEERLVLRDAQSPEALPDGSLLVVKISPGGTLRIHRFRPETGNVVPVGPPVVAESLGISARAAPGGREALFWGRLAEEGGGARPRQLHLLDLATGTTRPVVPGIPIGPPHAFSNDGRSVLATVAAGDVYRIVSVSRDGSDATELLTLTTRPSNLAAAPDGSIWVGLAETATDVLRFPASGGVPERLGSARGGLSSPGVLPDGRLLVQGLVAGRRRILVRSPSGETRPLVETAETSAPPVATLGGTRAVFLSGIAGTAPGLVLASIGEGRIVRRLPGTSGAAPQGLAASPDGRTVYYPDRGTLWAIDVDGDAPPRKLGAGHGVAVFPDGTELLVQRNGPDGVALFRVPVSGVYELPVPFRGDLRLAPAPLCGRAVGADGRVVVTVAARDALRWGAAFLDPLTGVVERIPVAFEGDVQSVGWTGAGDLVGLGVSLRTELWRFRPQP